MPAYRFTDGRKGWYFQFLWNGKKYKKERWKGARMNTKSDALRGEFEFKKELEQEASKVGGNISFLELFEEWMGTCKSNIKSSTLKNYQAIKKSHLVGLGDLNIKKLTIKDIVGWRNTIALTDMAVDGKNRILAVVRKCLEYGAMMYNVPGKLQQGLLEPFKDNRAIVIDERSKYIPEGEFKLMLSLLDQRIDNEFYYFTLLNLIYYTGLRIGEVAALTVGDIQGNIISITKDYVRVHGVDYIQSPKNSNSIRKVVMDQCTSDIIDEYITRFKSTGILFKNEGKYLNQQKLRAVLHRLAAKCGIDDEYEIKIHNLRHSHASNLRALGFDSFAIANRLGNTPEVSSSTYIHSRFEEQLELASKLRTN